MALRIWVRVFFLLGGDDGDWVFLEGDNNLVLSETICFFFFISGMSGDWVRLCCVALSDCKFDGFYLVP